MQTSEQWATLFENAAGSAGKLLVASRSDSFEKRLAWIRAYRDRYLQHRTTDAPVFAHVLGLHEHGGGFSASLWDDVADQSRAVEVWRHLATAQFDRASDIFDRLCVCSTSMEHSLTPGFDTTPIEQWTEQELSLMHALTSLGFLLSDLRILDRVYHAAIWHTRQVQPDNATNVPWACHTFAYAAQRAHDERREDVAVMASMHVETIVHAALLSATEDDGGVDYRGAALLIDAAEMMRKIPM